MTNAEIWEATLKELKGELTKQTFDARLARTYATVDAPAETLCVHADAASIEWLREGVLTKINSAVERVVGHALIITFSENGNAPPSDSDGAEQIVAESTYGDARAAIVKPNRIYPLTEYFRTQWIPRLGAELAWFVIALRQKAFWDKATGETRGGFKWHYEQAAVQIGISADALWRHRQKICQECKPPHKVLEHFILAEKPLYRYDERLGKRIRYATEFQVRMDEPLTATDEALLQVRLKDAPPTSRNRD